MNDYSDLIYLMGAMVLYSFLTLNVSRNMALNNANLADDDIEYEGIAVAQSHIHNLMWIQNEEEFKKSVDSLLTNKNYSSGKDPRIDKVSTDKGDLFYHVYADRSTTSVSGSDATHYKVTLGVGNKYLDENFNKTDTTSYSLKFEFMKSFDND